MLQTFYDTAWLLLPLLGGGVVHGFAMKHGWMPWLARPIDGGRRCLGVRLFGDNKTWRGPVCIGLGAALVFGIEVAASGGVGVVVRALKWAAFGFLYGFVAMLGELPNSFLKRRAGISPGAGGGGRFAWFFYLYDQVDLLIAVLPLWWCIGMLTWQRVAMAMVLVVVIHQAMSSIGYRLGMRKTPR